MLDKIIGGIVTLTLLGIGYFIGSARSYEYRNQRDRLADYIHQYHDIQGIYHNMEDSVYDIHFAIEAWEAEDNNAGDLGFEMCSDKLSFAY